MQPINQYTEKRVEEKERTILYSGEWSVCVCVLLADKTRRRQTDFILSTDESGGTRRSAECILGETMPLIRDPLNLGEMTAIHLSDSQQSHRRRRWCHSPKTWLIDVRCRMQIDLQLSFVPREEHTETDWGWDQDRNGERERERDHKTSCGCRSY